MQRTIPARTVTICDRCKSEITALGTETHLVINPDYREETCEEGFDLCRMCKADFTQFMNNER